VRLIGLVLALSLILASLAAEAEEAVKVARIGYLAANTLAASPPNLHEAFRQGLRDLGYVEGRNVVIEYREAEGKFERLATLAAELVALKVDVIVAPTTVAALAAKQVTRTIKELGGWKSLAMVRGTRTSPRATAVTRLSGSLSRRAEGESAEGRVAP
jgi:ABC-type uncharacterized transport system substrate-binding protein